MKQVELRFRRAADRMLSAGDHVLVAVSGGGDSVALLHLLARMSEGIALRLTVAHMDHGLRAGSASDREFVVAMARRLALEHVAERRPVEPTRNESPEEAARRARHRFLREAARRVGAARIALGHTLDDQAETILMRLARGAGPTSLAGMRPRGPGRLIRPLLELSRVELRAFLEHHAVEWLEDPSNDETRYDRNRVRRLVLPLLQRQLNPRAAEHLVAAAARLREDAAFLDAVAERELERLSRARRGGGLTLDARAVAGLDPPIARRVTRLALQRAGADGRRVSARHVGALLELATGPRGRSLDLPSGLRARRSADSLTLVRDR